MGILSVAVIMIGLSPSLKSPFMPSEPVPSTNTTAIVPNVPSRVRAVNQGLQILVLALISVLQTGASKVELYSATQPLISKVG